MSLLACLLFGRPALAAQSGDTVPLRIQIRDEAGAPVAGERVRLERLPDAELVRPIYTTGMAGRCTWHVGRGLYQVLFSRPVDDVSALALAEGGLRGFGLTVGEEAVTYHFTFHGDGHPYFDAAPEADVPVPIIPTPDVHHGGVAPTAVPVEPVTATLPAVVTPTPAASPAGRTSLAPGWRLLLIAGLGVSIGGGAHLWNRHRNGERKAPSGQKETPNA